MKNERGTIYIIGVFDLFHRGHIELLKRSRTLGKKLLVAVNGDDMVTQYKKRPILSEEDRLAMVEACRYVDEAFIIREFDNRPVLEKYPDISAILHGDDWPRQSYLEQIRLTEEDLLHFGIELVLIPYTRGISTSDIIKKIREIK